MAVFKRTTKQIAAKYSHCLGYFRRLHYLRLAKLACFLAAVGASLYWAFGRHEPVMFSTGPISANHARFADRCEVCHVGAQPDLLPAKDADGNPLPLTARVKAGWTALSAKLHPTEAGAGLERALHASGSMAALDEACHKCHEPMRLHQPQALSLALRPVRAEITAAQVDSCSTCHREHQGPGVMADPPSSNCITCHSNAQQLQNTLVTYHAGGRPPPATGAVLDFKNDNVRRFVPPRATPHQPAVFTAFNAGHPAFGYEQPGLRDPAAIAYNHARHEGVGIPKFKGHKLDCTDCHKPGADGVYMQRVTYQDHCSECHSLHFSADVPKLTIPHGDPQKVRDSLQSAGLTVLFLDYAVKELKIVTIPEQQAFIGEQFRKLQQRGIDTTEKLMIRAFRTGDPPNVTKDQAFPACAKCHIVQGPVGNATPTITPTNTADRWLTRGPFNHAPHAHMSCVDCHGQVLRSTKTTDINLPPQALCARCHRALEGGTNEPALPVVESSKQNPALVQRQLNEGGVSANCQYCHPRYHAPSDATVFTRAAAAVSPHQQIRQ